MSVDKVYGTPSACFLPARKWVMDGIKGPFIIKLPLNGKMSDYDPSMPDEDISIWTEDFNDTYKSVFNFGSVAKVLFALKAYPDLKDTEKFVVSNVAFTSDGNEVHIIGNIVNCILE